jgi:hypothetical protein
MLRRSLVLRIHRFLLTAAHRQMRQGTEHEWQVGKDFEGTDIGILSRGSGVGVATGVGVRVLIQSEFSLLHVVQTDSGAHPASYPMGSVGHFPRA